MWVNRWPKIFLWFQDMAYLIRKHKRGTWCLHENLALSIQSWVYAHPTDVFISRMQMKWLGFMSCHHRDPETYKVSNHVAIQSQWAYFYGCHVWHQQCEIPPIHIDGAWFSSHKGASHLGYHKLANMWRFSGVVECHVGKASLTYTTLETIMFHCGCCPTRTSSIVVGCTLLFYFLLHCLVFWYYVNTRIP